MQPSARLAAGHTSPGGHPAACRRTAANRVAPAASFASAVSTSCEGSASQNYRIPLKWGQRFTYLIEQTDLGASAPAGATGRAEFSNPLRQRITTTDSTTTETWFSKAASEPVTGSSKVPVRHTNRTSPSSRAAGYELGGAYYLSLPKTGSAVPAGDVPDGVGVAASQTGADSGDTTTLTIMLAIVAALGGAGLTLLVMQRRARKQADQRSQA